MYDKYEKAQHEISRGFDYGNYANAYETEDYEQASQAIEHESIDFQRGFMLGFFSSYELHEISYEWRDEVEHLRSLNLV